MIADLIADYAVKADEGYEAYLESLPDDMSSTLKLLALTEKIADTLVNVIGSRKMTKIYQLLLSDTAGTDVIKGYGRKLYALLYSIPDKGIQSGEFRPTAYITVCR